MNSFIYSEALLKKSYLAANTDVLQLDVNTRNFVSHLSRSLIRSVTYQSYLSHLPVMLSKEIWPKLIDFCNIQYLLCISLVAVLKLNIHMYILVNTKIELITTLNNKLAKTSSDAYYDIDTLSFVNTYFTI